MVQLGVLGYKDCVSNTCLSHATTGTVKQPAWRRDVLTSAAGVHCEGRAFVEDSVDSWWVLLWLD